MIHIYVLKKVKQIKEIGVRGALFYTEWSQEDLSEEVLDRHWMKRKQTMFDPGKKPSTQKEP